jgi:hypothetical protein
MTESTRAETFRVTGEQLLGKVKELIHAGNVRRIIITDKDCKELMQFPLTIGVIGVVFAPVLAAVGALAALVTECSITAVHTEEGMAEAPMGEAPPPV